MEEWIKALLQLAATAAPVPVIVALVEVLKGLGLESKWAPAVSVGLGLVAGGIAYAASIFPQIESALPFFLGGLVAGLLACGAYSGVKATLGR